MPDDDDNNTPPIEDLYKLLEEAQSELAAFNPKQHVKRSVSRRRVVDLSDILRNGFAPLIDWLDEELSPARAELRKKQLAGLDSRAWVFYAADLVAEDLDSSTTKAERAVLAKAVREHDAKLMTWAVPCFGDDPVLAATLRDISRGSGRRDDAEDVVRLVRMFKANWARADARQKEITPDYLSEAAADARKQLAILASQSNDPARKAADSAYALWQRDYNDLMQLGRYLTWTDDDSTQRFPGIHEPAKGGPAEVAVEDEELDEGELEGDEPEGDEDDEADDDDAELDDDEQLEPPAGD